MKNVIKTAALAAVLAVGAAVVPNSDAKAWGWWDGPGWGGPGWGNNGWGNGWGDGTGSGNFSMNFGGNLAGRGNGYNGWNGYGYNYPYAYGPYGYGAPYGYAPYGYPYGPAVAPPPAAPVAPAQPKAN